MRDPLPVLVLWASCLIAFIAIRPAPWSPGFWLLTVPLFVFALWNLWLSRRESAAGTAAWKAWERRVKKLADVVDVEDPHLFEWFDSREWDRIFAELERMPKGRRRLSKAIAAVDPDFPLEERKPE